MINVIVIEDNDADFVLARAAVSSHSTQINLSRAETLEEGINEIMTKSDIDLILVDLHLPDSFGVDTVKKLKSITNMPIVVLTGSDDDDELIVKSIQCGAFNYLHKSEMNGNLKRAIITAKAKSDINEEKREKLLGMIKYYFPTKEKECTHESTLEVGAFATNL